MRCIGFSALNSTVPFWDEATLLVASSIRFTASSALNAVDPVMLPAGAREPGDQTCCNWIRESAMTIGTVSLLLSRRAH